jgi:alkylhydroperoxidase/carboxymuconolactone decarboxylase family protein YurZ
MKKFETFLEKVKDLNQDEFNELGEILGRYKQLSNKNKELHETQDKYTAELDTKTKELTAYIK